MKRGDRARVYEDPVTCEKLEGDAVVKTKPVPSGDYDIEGRKLYRCKVRFGKEFELYERLVSEVVDT